MTRKQFFLISFLLIMAATAPAQDSSDQPNFLFIVADDLCHTDIGAFGSEIRIPNIDRLAAGGLRFTRSYGAPTRSPGRAMMTTGLANHLAGFGTMTEHLAENQKGRPGYEGYLNERTVTLPMLLRDGGYHTYMAGKWHIGASEGMRPPERGFECSFALMNGGAGHFSGKARVVSSYPLPTGYIGTPI